MPESKRPSFTPEHLRSILSYDKDTGHFTWRVKMNRNGPALGSVAGTISKNGYRMICISRRKVNASILAWYYMTGTWPEYVVDHVNRHRSDNRWVNLRLATRSQNQCNMSTPRTNTSGYKGVSWSSSRNKWVAHIGYNRKVKNLGRFDSFEDAVKARDSAEINIHGEFATSGNRNQAV